MPSLRAAALLVAVVASGCFAEPEGLTDETYDSFIAKGNHFVKFYAPWCGHCKKLAPTWEALSDWAQVSSDARISEVDCTTHKAVCQRNNVRSYPTLLWIENGQTVEKYSGNRSLEHLKEYVTSRSGPAVAPREAVKEITTSNFGDHVKNGVTFIKYFAPWCGHCKSLAPTWAELGEKFQDSNGITIAKVDCTQSHNIELCHKQEVSGYPTLYIYKDGEKLKEYEGERGLEQLVTFVKQYLMQPHDES